METSRAVAVPAGRQDAVEDADMESLEFMEAAVRRRGPYVDDRSAAALTALNRPGRLGTHALDWPAVVVSHTLLGDFVTEHRLRRDIAAVARAGARLEATSLHRDAAGHRPGPGIVDQVACREAQEMGRELQTLEAWSARSDDQELESLHAGLQRALRTQFGRAYRAESLSGGTW